VLFFAPENNNNNTTTTEAWRDEWQNSQRSRHMPGRGMPANLKEEAEHRVRLLDALSVRGALFRLMEMTKETRNYVMPYQQKLILEMTSRPPGSSNEPYSYSPDDLGIEDTEVARFGDLVCVLYTCQEKQ
jgi:hypothetical protein